MISLTRRHHQFALLGLALASAAIASCKKQGPGGDNLEDAETVHATPLAVKKVSVPKTIRLTGTLRGFRETDLAANAAGRILATSVERGQSVKAGTVLAELDVRAAALAANEARAQAESAKAHEAQAKAECERYEKLKASGAISDLEYDRVAANCRTLPLSAEAASARAQLAAQNVGDGIIRAPFAGVVTERHVEVGQYVRQDSRVVTIVSLDPLRLELAVPEKHVARIEEGSDVQFKVAAYPDKNFVGKIRFVSGAVRAATRDLVVEAIAENPNKLLRPGMFADASIAVGKHELFSVPKSAVVEKDGKTHAYFIVDGRLEERLLSLGPEVGDWVSVESGVKATDKVATGDKSTFSNGLRVR